MQLISAWLEGVFDAPWSLQAMQLAVDKHFEAMAAHMLHEANEASSTHDLAKCQVAQRFGMATCRFLVVLHIPCTPFQL